jgi:hypothetical protein
MNLFQELKELARNESLNEISQQAKIQKAIDIATSMGGNMTGAVKRIEAIKRGLSKNKNVANALRLANETVSEKFKPYLPKGSERVIDMYIQFRGNGEEKDFAKAKKMVMDYSKKHKLDIKDHPRNKVFGTPQEGSSAYKLSIYAKFTKDPNHDLAPLYKQLSTLKTAEDHGGGYAKPIKEETVSENYRIAARHGMGTEGKKEARVGLELDYYDREGVKHMGKIVKKDSKGYTVKDDKTGKMHTFVYHDRIIARKYIQKMGDNLGEGAFSVKLNKPYKRGDEKMYMDIIKKYGGKNLKFSPPKGRDPELDITFDGGDVKKIKSNLPNKGKDSEWISEGANPAQQAAIAISKKEKAGKPGYDKEGKSLKKESVMDTYRQMWRDASDIVEVTDKEINAMKQLSKDAEKIKKNYQKIVNMGDKELKDIKYNKEYEDILKMSQSVLSLIGKLQTQKIINKESLEEKLSRSDLKAIDQMYDKKGNLTDIGKAIMNYKPGDNIQKILQKLNKK